MKGRYQPEPNIPEGSGYEKYQHFTSKLCQPRRSNAVVIFKKAGPAKKTHRLQFDSSNALAPYRGWDGGNSLYIT